MIKFNVISDTHRISGEVIEKLVPVFNSGSFLVHLGDGTDDLIPFQKKLRCKIISVCGNCDLFSHNPKDIIIDSEAGKILFTHGDTHYVKSGELLNLSLFARENDCAYAFFGHTHFADIQFCNGIVCINPGSLSRPRVGFPSYCSVTIENGKLIPKIVLI